MTQFAGTCDFLCVVAYMWYVYHIVMYIILMNAFSAVIYIIYSAQGTTDG